MFHSVSKDVSQIGGSAFLTGKTACDFIATWALSTTAAQLTCSDRDLNPTDFLLVEFGAGTCNIDSGTGRECNAVMDECDRHFMSWIHWVRNGVADLELKSTADLQLPVFKKCKAE